MNCKVKILGTSSNSPSLKDVAGLARKHSVTFLISHTDLSIYFIAS